MNILTLAPLSLLPLAEALDIQRALVPFRMRWPARLAIRAVWPSSEERLALDQMQRSLLGRNPEMESWKLGMSVMPPFLHLQQICMRIAQRMDAQRRLLVRSLFAEEAHKQARRYQVKRQFDLLACYAGLARPDLIMTVPREAMSGIGGELLDAHIGLDMHSNPDAPGEYAEAIFEHLLNIGSEDLTRPE